MAQYYGGGGGTWITPKKTSPYIPGSYYSAKPTIAQVAGTYTTPKPTYKQPVQQPYVPPKVTQPYVPPQTPRYTGYTGQSQITMPKDYIKDYTTIPSMGELGPTGPTTDWQSLIPQLPAAPVVTAQMIADWLSRATGEAGLMYDPQAAGIGRELESSLLASEQSRGAIPGYYQDIIQAIKDWQKTTTEEEQRRWYARGLGQGGGLIEAEKGVAETALKETTKAETEKARLLTEITQQEELLKKQAGAKGTEIEVARSQYITSRQSELREKYETNQTQISQQQFQNQMQIAQFGFTAETQNFQNYLQQAEVANATWYNNALIKLQQESMSREERARQEALSWEKEKYGTTLAETQRQFDIEQKGAVATTGPKMFTIPGTNYDITVAQAINAGYIKPGQYAAKPEEELTAFEKWLMNIGGTTGTTGTTKTTSKTAAQQMASMYQYAKR